MNFKKFLSVLLCVVLTLSTVSVLALDITELPTEYCVAEEITGEGLNVMAVPVYDYEGEASPLELDIAMHFATTQSNAEAMTKPYYSYVADFELTFDHDVTALLAGKHRWFTDYVENDYWLAINAESETEVGGYVANLDGIDFKANESVKIMSFIDENFTYRDAISLGEFDCGVKFAYDAPEHIEAKLELVVYTTDEVTADDEYDYVFVLEGVNHYYKVNRDDRHVIVGKEFVYDNASHDFSKDATDAEKAEALNGDISSIDTKIEAVGAIDLVESLEADAKENVSPEAIKTIYESFNETTITVAENVYAAYSIQGGVTVDVEIAENVDPKLEGSELVLEVTAREVGTGEEVETLDFPALVAIPVDNAADVKKVLHLHDGALEELDFTPKTEGAKTIFVQMSKFSQIAVVEEATVYNITIPAVNGGVVTVNASDLNALEGQLVKITATPDADYALNSVTVTDAAGNPVVVTDNKFTMPASDVTVNAVFVSTIILPSRPTTSTTGGGSSVTTYTVKFDTNGGSEIKDVKVEKNKTVKEPEAPEKENNIFIGWYADKDLTEEFDFDTKITKATTIYAGWVEITAENSIVLVIDEKTATVFGETKENDVAPKIVNERTMLPARFVAENLGAEVEWDEETETVTITKDETIIEIFIGKSYAIVNGKEVDLDSPAFLENDRTYTPIRFISENLGANVNWDEETKTVTITKIK